MTLKIDYDGDRRGEILSLGRVRVGGDARVYECRVIISVGRWWLGASKKGVG